MWERIEPKLRDLARRAGMSEVPPKVIAAAFMLAVAACGWALWRWWPAGSPGSTNAVASAASASEAGDSESGDTEEAEGTGDEEAPAAVSAEATAGLFVHVAGEVRHPGVYELPAGSRVIDAVDKAGGMLGNAAGDALNLARQLSDGEQIYVPTTDEVADGTFSAGGASAGQSAGGGAAGSGTGAAGTALINLNTADAAALDTLPGVGPATADKIVADREANGPFASVEDLSRVSGIGPKKLEQLKDLVCVQ